MKMKFLRSLFAIWMRKWRPPDVSAENVWTVHNQILVSRVYRPEILKLAHETPMSKSNSTKHGINNTDESQSTVSDFKISLSKVCEAAQSNFKLAQSKLKLHYDANAQDRHFEPGDKVLALLPIPGRPLQSRYYGPYTVDKRLSDLTYTVNTFWRRKQKQAKQLCHINMLKSTLIGIVLSSVNLVNEQIKWTMKT